MCKHTLPLSSSALRCVVVVPPAVDVLVHGRRVLFSSLSFVRRDVFPFRSVVVLLGPLGTVSPGESLDFPAQLPEQCERAAGRHLGGYLGARLTRRLWFSLSRSISQCFFYFIACYLASLLFGVAHQGADSESSPLPHSAVFALVLCDPFYADTATLVATFSCEHHLNVYTDSLPAYLCPGSCLCRHTFISFTLGAKWLVDLLFSARYELQPSFSAHGCVSSPATHDKSNDAFRQSQVFYVVLGGALVSGSVCQVLEYLREFQRGSYWVTPQSPCLLLTGDSSRHECFGYPTPRRPCSCFGFPFLWRSESWRARSSSSCYFFTFLNRCRGSRPMGCDVRCVSFVALRQWLRLRRHCWRQTLRFAEVLLQPSFLPAGSA